MSGKKAKISTLAPSASTYFSNVDILMSARLSNLEIWTWRELSLFANCSWVTPFTLRRSAKPISFASNSSARALMRAWRSGVKRASTSSAGIVRYSRLISFSASFQLDQMFIKAFVRAFDQPSVELLRTDPRLVTCDQQHRLARWIERIGKTPNASIGVEAKFLHIGMGRAIERVRTRALQLWAKYAQQLDEGGYLVLNRLRELIELHKEFRMEVDAPIHCMNTLEPIYLARYISRET